MKPNKLLLPGPKVSRIWQVLLAFFGILTVLFLWSIVSYSGLIEPFFLPTPTAVIQASAKLFQEFGLAHDIGVSVYRILLGFGLAVIVSVPLGVLLGINRKLEVFFEPIISFIRYIPPSAFVPLFILWFGIGDLQKTTLIFVGVAPYLILLVFDVVANTKREFVEAAYTLGATTNNIIFRVILPQSLPGIWDAMRIMIGAAWTLVVLAEIIAATSGLGYLIITSQRFLKTPNVIAAILIIGLLGLITDFIFKITYKIFFPWTEKSRYA